MLGVYSMYMDMGVSLVVCCVFLLKGDLKPYARMQNLALDATTYALQEGGEIQLNMPKVTKGVLL